MGHAILCTLRDDSEEARLALRPSHLAYVQAHADFIVAGGPVLDAGGDPSMMILLTRIETTEEAERFIAAEPYTASGKVFAVVEVRRWSQVLP